MWSVGAGRSASGVARRPLPEATPTWPETEAAGR